MLDFGGNVLRHGPVDDLRIKPRSGAEGEAPAKECPECQAVIAAGYATCPQCGYEFPPPERQQHEAKASDAGHPVGPGHDDPDTRSRTSSTASTPSAAQTRTLRRSLRVDYRVGWPPYCNPNGSASSTRATPARRPSPGGTRRSPDPVPETVEEALARIEGGALAQTYAITVRSVAGEQYDRIIDYELGPLPEAA